MKIRMENRMLSAPMAAPPCRICSIAEGSSGDAAHDQPWLTDDAYLALVSLGALVPGWSLVIPKKHSLNLSDEYANEGFFAFAGRVHQLVQERFGRAVIFEHGSQAVQSATSCGTAHSHLHVVPLSFALTEAAVDFDLGITWQRCRLADVKDRIRGKEYLFAADYFDGPHTEGIFTILNEERSQFFRQVIAAKIGRSPEFDYKLHPQKEMAASSALILREFAKRSLAIAA